MCLYAWILDVGRCADLVPVCFGVDCGTLCRSSFCMLRCWMRGAVPIYFWGIRPAALLVMDCFEAVFCMLRCWTWNAVPIYFYILCFLALGRMYIRFYSLFSAVEFSAGDVATVWAAAEEV